MGQSSAALAHVQCAHCWPDEMSCFVTQQVRCKQPKMQVLITHPPHLAAVPDSLPQDEKIFQLLEPILAMMALVNLPAWTGDYHLTECCLEHVFEARASTVQVVVV